MKRVSISLAVLLATTDIGFADHMDVKIAPAIKEYCHIVRFPEGWKLPPGPGLDNLQPYDRYEFRASGQSTTKFLVGGFLSIGKKYTLNKYEIDLADFNALVLPTTDQVWESATRVSASQKSAVARDLTRLPDQAMEYRGIRYSKSGARWSLEGGRLSPDQAWLVLQSWTGSAGSGGETGFGGCFPFGCRGKIFFDIFNVDAGKRVLTIEGTYSGRDPEGELLETTEWLTERYFIVPLGDHRERCLVCEFGDRRPGRMNK